MPQPAAVPIPQPLVNRLAARAYHGRRLGGSALAVAVALLLGWYAVNGKNGLNAWQQKRAEDRALRAEIDQLQAENARLRNHVDRLKSNPDAIENEIREQLHYARPGEVIYALPERHPEDPQPQPVGNQGK